MEKSIKVTVLIMISIHVMLLLFLRSVKADDLSILGVFIIIHIWLVTFLIVTSNYDRKK